MSYTIKNPTEIRTLARAIVNKISTQRPPGPESNLMFAVFTGAIVDYYSDNHLNAKSASIYLTRKESPHLAALGIDTSWAMGLFKKAKLVIKLHPYAEYP